MKESKKGNSFILFRYSLMAFPLSFLGIPLYMHIPKFYHDYYGVPLEVIGIILFSSRLLDAFIDPFMGVLSDKLQLTQKKYFVLFGFALVFFFNALFYVDSGLNPVFTTVWFTFCTIFIYIFFSIILINYYNLGLCISTNNSLRVKSSSFREMSSFLGMVFASILPLVLIKYFHNQSKAFSSYAAVFSLLVFIAVFALPKTNLQKSALKKNQDFLKATTENLSFIFKNASMKTLLFLFFINALPLAITSNLLIFYVNLTLKANESMPLFLLSYLLAGACGAAACSLFFKSYNKVSSLLFMMLLSAVSFCGAYFLNSEHSDIFYFVCVFSGFGAGGELVMLLAIAASVLEDHKSYGNSFFALWTSATKLTLAISAGIFLPLISVSNVFFTQIKLENKITFYYAGIPLIIKMLAIAMVFFIKSRKLRGLT